MSFLLISVVHRLDWESANVDNILTYKKIFVLALRCLFRKSYASILEPSKDVEWGIIIACLAASPLC